MWWPQPTVLKLRIFKTKVFFMNKDINVVITIITVVVNIISMLNIIILSIIFSLLFIGFLWFKRLSLVFICMYAIICVPYFPHVFFFTFLLIRVPAVLFPSVLEGHTRPRLPFRFLSVVQVTPSVLSAALYAVQTYSRTEPVLFPPSLFFPGFWVFKGGICF